MHVGLSLDFDGCADVLLMLIDDEEDRETFRKHTQDPFHVEDLTEKYRAVETEALRQQAILFVKTIRDLLDEISKKQKCEVHVFVGSNRQSYAADEAIMQSSKDVQNRWKRMWPLVPVLVNILNKHINVGTTRIPQFTHTFTFEKGTVSDTSLSLTDPNLASMDDTTYGKGFQNKKASLHHPFEQRLYVLFGPVTFGQVEPAIQKEFKEKLNRYHAWRLYNKYGGTNFLFFDDRKEFVEDMNLEGYPPCRVTGVHFNYDYHIENEQTFEKTRDVYKKTEQCMAAFLESKAEVEARYTPHRDKVKDKQNKDGEQMVDDVKDGYFHLLESILNDKGCVLTSKMKEGLFPDS